MDTLRSSVIIITGIIFALHYVNGVASFVLRDTAPRRVFHTRESTSSVEQSQVNVTVCKNDDVNDFETRTTFDDIHISDCMTIKYSCNELRVIPRKDIEKKTKKIKATVLIQPIGVGIGRWYYDDLLKELSKYNFSGTIFDEYVFLAPDLLGCGTAANARGKDGTILKRLPMFTVDDWSYQIINLMQSFEKQCPIISGCIDWSIVSNGGCVPIALEVAKQYIQNKDETTMFYGRLKNLVLSATPRADSLIRPEEQKKVVKAYKRLCGFVGNIFWWYALRRNGAFIEKFSEKNLLASKPSQEWTAQCVKTAKSLDGKSRYSTFAFLAGSLNGASKVRLEVLKNRKDISVDVITGTDKRKNPANSWFWGKRQKAEQEEKAAPEQTSMVEMLKENGNTAREIFVNGRRCPAYEDPQGFAHALVELIDL
jgi:hypothetical protein